MTQVLFATVILAALGQLDPTNDRHWTAGGLPRLDVVKELTKEASLIRDHLTAVAPEFTRTNPVLPTVEPEGETEPARQDDPPANPEDQATAETKDEAGGEPQLQVTKPEQPPVEDRSVVLENEAPTLEQEMEAVKLALEEASAAYAAAQKEFLAVQAKHDAVLEALEAAKPVHDNQLAIVAYLAAQSARRQQMAEQSVVRKAPVDIRSRK